MNAVTKRLNDSYLNFFILDELILINKKKNIYIQIKYEHSQHD